MRYYLDTEFNGFGGQLISIALVKEIMTDIEADSFYCVMNDFNDANCEPWIQQNVLPILTKCGEARVGILSPSACADRLAKWLAPDPHPTIITDWPADIRYFCELIEFPMGKMAAIPGLTFELHRVDAYPTTLRGAVQHNAWWDAMALRHLFNHGRMTPP